MSQHAPLYGVGLADLSINELETLSRIHEEGLREIEAIKMQKSRAVISPVSVEICSKSHTQNLNYKTGDVHGTIGAPCYIQR